MTREDAVKVVAIMRYADGGCGPCIGDLCTMLRIQFPNLRWEGIFTEALVDSGALDRRFVDSIMEATGPTYAAGWRPI